MMMIANSRKFLLNFPLVSLVIFASSRCCSTTNKTEHAESFSFTPKTHRLRIFQLSVTQNSQSNLRKNVETFSSFSLLSPKNKTLHENELFNSLVQLTTFFLSPLHRVISSHYRISLSRAWRSFRIFVPKFLALSEYFRC